MGQNQTSSAQFLRLQSMQLLKTMKTHLHLWYLGATAFNHIPDNLGKLYHAESWREGMYSTKQNVLFEIIFITVRKASYSCSCWNSVLQCFGLCCWSISLRNQWRCQCPVRFCQREDFIFTEVGFSIISRMFVLQGLPTESRSQFAKKKKRQFFWTWN